MSELEVLFCNLELQRGLSSSSISLEPPHTPSGYYLGGSGGGTGNVLQVRATSMMNNDDTDYLENPSSSSPVFCSTLKIMPSPPSLPHQQLPPALVLGGGQSSPLDCVPRELLWRVLDFLPFSGRLGFLSTCRKSWHAGALADTIRITTNSPTCLHRFQWLVERSVSRLHTLILADSDDLVDDHLLELLPAITRVENLDLTRCRWLTDTSVCTNLAFIITNNDALVATGRYLG